MSIAMRQCALLTCISGWTRTLQQHSTIPSQVKSSQFLFKLTQNNN